MKKFLYSLLLYFLITTQSAFAVSYGSLLGSGGDGPTQFANFASFPASANDGSLAMDQASGTLYVWFSGSWQIVGAPGVVVSFGAIDGQAKNAQGGAISGNTIYQQSADATWPGILLAADWSTFNNKEPAITATTAADYYRGDKTFQTLNGAAVANTPAGNIAAVTVQAAINELDSEKFTLPSLTAGSVLFSDGSTIAQDNSGFFYDDATNRLFMGSNASIGGSNAGIQFSNADTANRGQIKLHSYFNGDSIAGVSTLTSRSGVIGTNAAVVAGQEYSKWTAQAGATTPGSAPISGNWSFVANTVNALTVTSDYRIQLTNLAGTLGTRFFLGSEGALQLPFYGSGYAKFDASGNITSAFPAASEVTNVPAGGIAATDVQAAINELDTEKQATGNYITDLTGDVTATGPGSVAATIAANAVTDTKLRDSAALSVIGRSVNSAGDPADIAAAADFNILRRSGVTIGFGAIDLSQAGAVGASILANANTTATSANTANAIVSRDASGDFSAGIITASLSGNASTATALAANGANCAAGQYPKGVDASGAAESCTAISLTADVSGVLPVANGGTNSSTALNNNRVMQSSAGAIVEAAAITAARALISDANGIPTHSATTATELGYVNGVTSAIQTQLNGKQASFTDIQEIPAGVVNNSNTAFTLSQTPSSSASVSLYRDGLILVQGTDYTIVGTAITMTLAPDFFQQLYAVYRY